MRAVTPTPLPSPGPLSLSLSCASRSSPRPPHRWASPGASTTRARPAWWRRAAALHMSAASATTTPRTTPWTGTPRWRWCAWRAAQGSPAPRTAASAAWWWRAISARCATSGTTPRTGMCTIARSATCAGGARGWARTSSTACSATRASVSPWGRTNARTATTTRALAPVAITPAGATAGAGAVPWRATAPCAKTSSSPRTPPSSASPAAT
mmetsp:Transcript_14912/g.36638  ORF Transcript_14912/g.36638 Transcript_14912/m.36638 type:complete len:211 (-) Transcript_14912:420-1052(-)